MSVIPFVIEESSRFLHARWKIRQVHQHSSGKVVPQSEQWTTTEVEHVRCTIGVRHVVFIDTPAFPDPGYDDNVVAKLHAEGKIQEWLQRT